MKTVAPTYCSVVLPVVLISGMRQTTSLSSVSAVFYVKGHLFSKIPGYIRVDLNLLYLFILACHTIIAMSSSIYA